MLVLAVFLALVFLYSLASERLGRTPITPPIVFTAAGLLLQLVEPHSWDAEASRSGFLRIAEVGLVMTLFVDASRTDRGLLKSFRNLPVRLLSIGMLLTILLGTVAARLLFPALSWWEAGILGAILAPTDAGLGQVIVQSERLPVRVRQTLNVEAGLNDGLAAPFLLFFLALAVVPGDHTPLKRFLVEQLGFGTVIGIAVGFLGGVLLRLASQRRWMESALQPLGLVTLPLLCILLCEATAASMFIAAFVAGLAVQVRFAAAGKHAGEFIESWGQLLNWFVFFLFGAISVPRLHAIQWQTWMYAAASLTVIRMLPVAIALIGTRLDRATILFLGWFGPRGMASIVLGLVFLEAEATLPGEATIALAVTVTVLLSIFAHGSTAAPGIAWYASTRGGVPGTRAAEVATKAPPGGGIATPGR